MVIIKYITTHLVIFAGEDLYLNSLGCGSIGQGWFSSYITDSTAYMEEVDTLPEYFTVAGWIHSGGIWEINSYGQSYKDALLEGPAVIVPEFVSMRQTRLALLGAGVLTTVKALIAESTEEVQIYWDTAQEVHRNNEIVLAVQTELGLTDAQLDAMFISASTL